MEGFLLVPPDRGTIIGRAVWKPRYVILGSPFQQRPPPDSSLPRTTSSSRLQAVRKGMKASSSSKDRQSPETSTAPPSDQLWLSIYKQKGDREVIAQYSIASMKSCEIQDIQYRKPGPALPTLVIALEPDPTADKARKRRSSKTGGFSSFEKAFPNTLFFRTLHDERYNIYDWQITIQPEIKPTMDGFHAPMSPTSPLFDSFINPFSGSRTDTSTKTNFRPDLHHRGSSTTYASTQSVSQRPNTSTLISPSPSLRSRSSDISSSQASFFNRNQPSISGLPIQQLPSDLPSPALTGGYDDSQSILGWTSAQGRSSALSNHTRASNSFSVSGTPPAPRETILDRAFMMRYIPGSDRQSSEEENGRISSIARFEALMKEAEDRRKAKDASDKIASKKSNATGWELEEKDENSDAESEPEADRSRDSDDDFRLEDDVDPLSLSIHEMPTPAQRALEYISGRITPHSQHRRPRSPAPPLPRPQPPLRTRTTPPVTRRQERPKSLVVSSTSYSNLTSLTADQDNLATTLKRNSSASASTKRLSFTDFAKRLSSTSSLLLVQTNASTGSTSSRNSDGSLSGDAEEVTLHRGLSQSRLSGMGMSGPSVTSRTGEASGNDTRSHWRGSGLGVFGGEGGFM